MDSEQIIAALRSVREEIFHKRHATADLWLCHIITSLTEPPTKATPTTDEESVPF